MCKKWIQRGVSLSSNDRSLRSFFFTEKGEQNDRLFQFNERYIEFLKAGHSLTKKFI